MQGIEREVSENFGIDVRNIVPYKDTFMIVTSQGRKVIRKMPFSPERVLFVHGAKEHLVHSGFTGVDRYLCTLSGDPFFYLDNSCCTITDFIDGRESSFDSEADVKRVSKTLAEMHRASRGYAAPEGGKIQDDLGKLPGYFTKRLEDIRKMRKQAKKGKGRFDQLFLECTDYFCELGEDALTALKASEYPGLVDRCKADGMFCHHDYTHHNIIMSEGKVTVINFDYCCYELRVYDIANLIRRKMRKCDWDISQTELILNSYQSVEPLGKDELELMRIILQFPQKFWRVANRYYNSRRSWSERSYAGRLQEVIDEIAPHKQFMIQLSQILR